MDRRFDEECTCIRRSFLLFIAVSVIMSSSIPSFALAVTKIELLDTSFIMSMSTSNIHTWVQMFAPARALSFIA